MNLLMESFALYPNLTAMVNSGRYVNTTVSNWTSGVNSIVAGRFDSGGYQFSGGNTINGPVSFLGASYGTLYAGFARKFASAIGAIFFAFLDSTSPIAFSGTSQVELFLDVTGVLKVRRNGTVLATSTQTVTFGVWHYFEVGAFFNSTTGSVTVKVDGVTWISLTNVNTQGSSLGSANQISHFGNFSGDVIDDVYVNDNTGSFNNTFLGDVKVVGNVPTGDGTLSQYAQNVAVWVASTATATGTTITDGTNLQRCTANTGDTKTGGSTPTWNGTLGGTTTDNHVTWTNLGTAAAYKLVNELPPDGDSSYLSDSTVSDQARFTFPSVSGAGVYAVAVYGSSRKDDAGTRSIRFVAKSSGTVGDSGTDLPQTSAYQNFRGLFETNPNTSAAWTVSAVNAAEFGVKTTA